MMDIKDLRIGDIKMGKRFRQDDRPVANQRRIRATPESADAQVRQFPILLASGQSPDAP